MKFLRQLKVTYNVQATLKNLQFTIFNFCPEISAETVSSNRLQYNGGHVDGGRPLCQAGAAALLQKHRVPL
jgi:hypothetical protein